MDIKKYQSLIQSIRCQIAEFNDFGAKPLNLRNYFRKKRIESERHAKSLMPEQVLVMEMSVNTLILLTRYISDGKGGNQRNAFLAQLYRALNLLIGSMELILSGLEETARVTSRSYIETLDILLAILSDEYFSENFFGEEADYEELWKTEIGYGKVYAYVRNAMELAGLGEEANAHIVRRKNLKNLLSSSVHGDDTGAFRSWAISPLGWPDMISTEPHGVISFHAANHAVAISSETYRFVVIFLKCLMAGRLDSMHEFSKDSEDHQRFIAHFFVLQEIMHEFELPNGEEIIAKGHVVSEDW